MEKGLGGEESENFGIISKQTFTELSPCTCTLAAGVIEVKKQKGLFLKSLEFTEEQTCKQVSLEVYSSFS